VIISDMTLKNAYHAVKSKEHYKSGKTMDLKGEISSRSYYSEVKNKVAIVTAKILIEK
jgi:hypothetical protein